MRDVSLKNMGRVRQSLAARVKAYGLLVYKKALPFRKYALPTIAFVIGIVIGDGVLWQARNYNLGIKKFTYEIGKEQTTLLYEILQSIERNRDQTKS